VSTRISYGHVAWFPDPAAGTVRLGDREVPRVVRAEIGDPLDTAPMVFVRLEVIDDRPQCREVRIESAVASPEGHGREVRQGDLDGFRIADWIERVFVLSAWPTYTTSAEAQADQPALRAAVTSARKSRPRVDLEEVAEVYRRHVDDRPTEAVRLAFGWKHSTAAEYVRRARRAGLLPATTPGKRRA
jgi:hypothetical protein